MGQDISLKSKRKTHDLNHELTFSAHTINCVCHSIRSMFRVLGIYIFDKVFHNFGMIFSTNMWLDGKPYIKSS